MRKFCAAVALGSLAVLVVGHSAFATVAYPNYIGTNVTFSGIQETSSFGDPEPLFGAPTGVGNQLLFFPANFTAQAVGVSQNDATGAQLQATITAAALTTIDVLNISEFGDATLIGAPDSGTGVFASMSGFVTVLEVNGLAVVPIVIGFNAGGGVNGSMSPVAVGSTGLDRISNPGTTLWSGTVSVNLAALVPNATKVVLSFDNDLYAYTSAAGGDAKIQKKVVSGPAIIIEIVPEPGTAALLCVGLVAMTLRARGRRS